MSPYKVMVDDNFHYQNEEERNELGNFSTAEEAIAACKRVVDEDLSNSYKPADTVVTPEEQIWLTKAFSHLKKIDAARTKRRERDQPYCVFAFNDNVFVQFLARSHTKQLVCEAVSARFGSEIAKLLTSEREALLYSFGFEPVGISPNYSQQIDIESDDDLGYATRLAFRVLKIVYQIIDFSSGSFKLHIPSDEAMS
jgi:hypothetical protein